MCQGLFNGDPLEAVNVLRSDLKAEVAKNKPQPLLCPKRALEAYHAVSNYGLKKYGTRDSWKNSKDGVREYLNAAGRHILDVGDGETLDSESGLPHVYHILWNAVAVVWHYEEEKAQKAP